MRHFLRFLEGIILFVGLPLIVYNNLLPIPKIAALLAITLLCVTILWGDSGYMLRRLLYRPHIDGMWKKMLMRAGAVAGSLIVLTIILQPERLFSFPRERTSIWFIVMLLYPLLSVLPQEIIYREFFFHRYKKIMKSEWMMVTASAAAFSFLHIVYDNYYAVILSLIGGFMFARTYQQTRSLYWVCVEHAIYGCILFTVGLGNYFYEGF